MKHCPSEPAEPGGARCLTCRIREMSLFADLEPRDLDLIHLPIAEVQYAVGDVIYSAGDDGAAIYTVRSGLVKLVRYLPDGTQRIVRLLRRGEAAGLEVVVGQPYGHTAIALYPAELCRIPRPVIERLSRETPRLHDQLMRRWHAAVAEADGRLTELSTGKAQKRLARLFLQLVQADGTAMLFSREDIGAMLGISREHACRAMADLKRHRVIFELSANHFRCDLARLAVIGSREG
ncbi:MAG: Crp/Fnr family transcriptional regulator [Telmatospirillum sp.]|nr:Crp/Fnr family transcriptional regulator [Telmatospirillum sp.]